MSANVSSDEMFDQNIVWTAIIVMAYIRSNMRVAITTPNHNTGMSVALLRLPCRAYNDSMAR